MIQHGTFHTTQSSARANRLDDHEADHLVAAIRKPLDALDCAAEQAALGLLGSAKLGMLVAANGLIDAIRAVDAEFARRYGTSATRRPDASADPPRSGTGHV